MGKISVREDLMKFYWLLLVSICLLAGCAAEEEKSDPGWNSMEKSPERIVVRPNSQQVREYKPSDLGGLRFGHSELSPDANTLVFELQTKDGAKISISDVSDPAAAPTDLITLTGSEVPESNALISASWSDRGNFVAVRVYKTVVPRNQLLVVHLRSKTIQRLSEIVRKRIDAELSTKVFADAIHQEMKDRTNCTYSGQWNPDESLSFTWDYSGDIAQFKAVFEPHSGNVVWDPRKP